MFLPRSGVCRLFGNTKYIAEAVNKQMIEKVVPLSHGWPLFEFIKENREGSPHRALHYRASHFSTYLFASTFWKRERPVTET